MQANKYRIQHNSQFNTTHNSTELSNLLHPAHAQTSSITPTFSTSLAAQLHQTSPRSIPLQQCCLCCPNPPTPDYLGPHNTLPPLQLPASHSGHPDLTPGQISGGQSGNDQGVSSFSLPAPSTIAPYPTSALYSYQKDKRAKSETF